MPQMEGPAMIVPDSHFSEETVGIWFMRLLPGQEMTEARGYRSG